MVASSLLSCELSLSSIHYVNGVFTPAFTLTAESNGEFQIKTNFGGPPYSL
jgi:hypothetical protein